MSMPTPPFRNDLEVHSVHRLVTRGCTTISIVNPYNHNPCAPTTPGHASLPNHFLPLFYHPEHLHHYTAPRDKHAHPTQPCSVPSLPSRLFMDECLPSVSGVPKQKSCVSNRFDHIQVTCTRVVNYILTG